MKILILVLSVSDSGGVYDSFYKSQKETWNAEDVDNIDTYYIYGGDRCEIIDKNIFTGIEEVLFSEPGGYFRSPLSAGLKTIKALEMLNDIGIEYDFVFRTNLSSYIDKKILYKHLLDKSKKEYYSGFIGKECRNIFGHKINEIEYASGSGIILSKDFSDFLIEKKYEIDNESLIDDVAFGQVFNKNGIYPIFLNRIDILNKSIDMKSDIDFEYFFYRLRSNNRDLDIKNMYEIHKRKVIMQNLPEIKS